jgi:signal peptide peptidase SppA
MKSLVKDIRGKRPLLISPSQAEAYLARTADVAMPLGAKLSDMGDMIAAIFGAKETIEKFPPYAIIPVKGCIGKGLAELEALCGACDVETVEEMLEDAERDPSITTIILDVDSPGGTSVGVPELANRIRNCSKDVISFTDGEACSAAYWIASQANKAFYATPSSTVGSIGVYICFTNSEKLYESEGLRQELFKAGKYKGLGIEGLGLSPDQRDLLQAEVDDIHADFKAAVTSVREFVSDDAMQGQCFSGKRAAEAGLVTSLVNGFDELMEELNAQVAAQMEADEENDVNHEIAELPQGEHGEAEENSISKYAAGRALKGMPYAAEVAAGKLKPRAEAAEGDDPDQDSAEPMPSAKDNRDPQDPLDPQDEPDEEPEMKCVVSDFDGTIRSEADDDKPIEPVVKHLKQMAEKGKQVHVVTGRHESRRAETSAYLDAQGLKVAGLHMKADEAMPTTEHKVAAVKAIEAEHGKVKHILENNSDCTEAYKAAGYNCIHPDAIGAAVDVADSGERGLDTDKKADKSEFDKHRGRSIA